MSFFSGIFTSRPFINWISIFALLFSFLCMASCSTKNRLDGLIEKRDENLSELEKAIKTSDSTEVTEEEATRAARLADELVNSIKKTQKEIDGEVEGGCGGSSTPDHCQRVALYRYMEDGQIHTVWLLANGTTKSCVNVGNQTIC